MRILNIMQCTQLGGMEQAAFRLMQALQTRGHECRVLSLNPLGDLRRKLEEANIPAVGLLYKGVMGWRSFPALYRQIRSEPADALIMTGHNLLAMLALGQHCKGHRFLAMHFHHAGIKPDWHWRLLYRLAQKRFQAISYPSDFVRFEAEAIHPPIRSITCTIRNPLHVPADVSADDRSEARRKLALPPDAVVIGNAGWLIDRKRFDVFLQAAAKLAKEWPIAHFAVAGDGPERDRLTAMAEALGISDRVHWLGWVQEMRDFYCSIDVLLFNSDWDALGNTPLEAMTYGVPVAASVLNGGLKEAITDDRFGYLLHEHDPSRLAAAVSACLSPAGKAMARRGKERVKAWSDPQTIAKEVEDILLGTRSDKFC